MMTALPLVALLFFEAAFLRLAAARSERLRMHVLVNMICVSLFGGALLSLGEPGLVTNATSACYASVMAAQYLTMYRFGANAARTTIALVLVALLLLFCIMGAICALPVLEGNEPERAAYRTVLDGTARFVMASFIAFVIGQSVFVALYKRFAHLSTWSHYAVPVVVAQAVDSAVFFPIAFGLSDDSLHIALVGFWFKAALGIASVPMVWLFANCRAVAFGPCPYKVDPVFDDDPDDDGEGPIRG